MAFLWQPRNMRKLFFDVEVREEFVRIDLAEIKSSYFNRPPSHLKGYLPSDNDPEHVDEQDLFVCAIEDDQGHICGHGFRTRAALSAHQRSSTSPRHGIRSILKLLQVDNCCLVCSTTFPSRAAAGDHLERSWAQGRCIRNRTHHPYAQIDTSTDVCAVCGEVQQGDFASWRMHLRAHIPVSRGRMITVTEPKGVEQRGSEGGDRGKGGPDSHKPPVCNRHRLELSRLIGIVLTVSGYRECK